MKKDAFVFDEHADVSYDQIEGSLGPTSYAL